MNTSLFDWPWHTFCSGPLSICHRVSHDGAWGLVGSYLCWPQCIPTCSTIPYQFLNVVGDPGWKPCVCLVQVFGVCIWKLDGPHSKATVATIMNCAKKPFVLLMDWVIALPHATATPTNMFQLWAAACTSAWGLTT